MEATHMLSSDVSAAFDPNYAGAFEKKNIAFIGRGMVFNKYTGARENPVPTMQAQNISVSFVKLWTMQVCTGRLRNLEK